MVEKGLRFIGHFEDKPVVASNLKAAIMTEHEKSHFRSEAACKIPSSHGENCLVGQQSSHHIEDDTPDEGGRPDQHDLLS